MAEARCREVDEFGSGRETAVRRGDEEGPVVAVAVVVIVVGLETTTTERMFRRREDVPLLESAGPTTTPLCRHANSTNLLARAVLERLEPGFTPPQEGSLGLGESEENHFRIGGRDATVRRGRGQSGEGGGESLLEQSSAALVHVGRSRVLGGDVLRVWGTAVGRVRFSFRGMPGQKDRRPAALPTDTLDGETADTYLEPGQVNDRNGRPVCLPLRARVDVVLRQVLTRAADDRVCEIGELAEVKDELFRRLYRARVTGRKKKGVRSRISAHKGDGEEDVRRRGGRGR